MLAALGTCPSRIPRHGHGARVRIHRSILIIFCMDARRGVFEIESAKGGGQAVRVLQVARWRGDAGRPQKPKNNVGTAAREVVAATRAKSQQAQLFRFPTQEARSGRCRCRCTQSSRLEREVCPLFSNHYYCTSTTSEEDVDDNDNDKDDDDDDDDEADDDVDDDDDDDAQELA
ncbi:hypothetical protein DOTSEDRAFT_34755 [Dothistroma septosporum NZE10]|uniref:Uncharacterized protein n=1 Tax=Dothistroma septosporum (strain NZE10 / CBS 128990) TaxID=675120 RepID=N1PL97_DOTSN|nr:hypothetical protein DOTSEDRAFT_34755 [Dothistroma septosporum NZE10]